MNTCPEPIFNNTLIYSNEADAFGGGVYIYDSKPILNFTSIANNTALSGAGIQLTGHEGFDPTPIIKNSII